MENVTLNVLGMSCGKCKNAVETSVGTLEGVSEVTVDLAQALVSVSYDDASISVDAIKETIEDQGYDVQ